MSAVYRALLREFRRSVCLTISVPSVLCLGGSRSLRLSTESQASISPKENPASRPPSPARFGHDPFAGRTSKEAYRRSDVVREGHTRAQGRFDLQLVNHGVDLDFHPLTRVIHACSLADYTLGCRSQGTARTIQPYLGIVARGESASDSTESRARCITVRQTRGTLSVEKKYTYTSMHAHCFAKGAKIHCVLRARAGTSCD
jgi:hypothetical protein